MADTLHEHLIEHLVRSGARLEVGDGPDVVVAAFPGAQRRAHVTMATRQGLGEEQTLERLCQIAGGAGDERVVLALPESDPLIWPRAYDTALAVWQSCGRPIDLWKVTPAEIIEVMATRPW